MNSPAPVVNSHPVCCWAEARLPRGGAGGALRGARPGKVFDSDNYPPTLFIVYEFLLRSPGC